MRVIYYSQYCYAHNIEITLLCAFQMPILRPGLSWASHAGLLQFLCTSSFCATEEEPRDVGVAVVAVVLGVWEGGRTEVSTLSCANCGGDLLSCSMVVRPPLFKCTFFLLLEQMIQSHLENSCLLWKFLFAVLSFVWLNIRMSLCFFSLYY